MTEHTHEEMLFRIATLEEQVASLGAALGLVRRQPPLEAVLDETLAVLPPSVLTPEAQDIVKRIMADRHSSAYLDHVDHDRGQGG